MKRTHSILIVVLLTISCLAVLAAAQQPEAPPSPMEPAQPPEQDGDADAPMQAPVDLGGPRVPLGAVRSLVHYNARGEFQRLDTLPEIAALDLLPLDAARRQETWTAIEAGRDATRDLLIDHIELLREATDAQRAGDRQRVQELYRTLYDLFEPDHASSSLVESIEAVLSESERADYAALLEEYWTAWVNWELRRTAQPSDEQRRTTRDNLAFGLFQQQLARAYESSLRPYQRRLESIYEITSPSDEQRARIREIVIDFIRTSRLSPSAEQQTQLATDLYGVLDDEQRIRFMEYALFHLR